MHDYTVGDTFDIKFTTRKFSTGAPFTLAGSPVIAAYPDNSTTQLTAGITLSVDFDSVTGLNNIRVVATGGNGYAAGSTYSLVITTGTVDGVSVVGEVVGAFTLGRSAAFARLGAPAGASIAADIATRATPAQVNTEVVDVMTVDTIAELAQAVPATTPTFATALMLMYMAMRNNLDIDATTKKVANNAGTVIAKKVLSDNGTTYTEAKMVAGP
jgi:hypothetical protein